MKRLLITLFFLVSASVARAGSDPVENISNDLMAGLRQQKNAKVAVVGLCYYDGHKSDGPGYLSERITQCFVKDKRLRILERDHIVQILREMHLAESGVIDPKSTKRVGEVIGADVIVTGTLIDLDGQKTEFNARAILAGTGRVIAASHAVLDRTWTSRQNLLFLSDFKAPVRSSDPLRTLSKKLKNNIKEKECPSMAVLNFPYSLGRLNTGSILVSERLVTYLVNEGAPVVERRLLPSLLEEKKMMETGLIGSGSFSLSGQVSGVDAIVIGSLADSPDEKTTEVQARVVRVGTGEILSAGSALINRLWLDTPVLPKLAQERSPIPGSFEPKRYSAAVAMQEESSLQEAPQAPPTQRKLAKKYLAIDGRGNVPFWLGNYQKKAADTAPDPATRPPQARLYRAIAIPVLAPTYSNPYQGGLRPR